MPHGGNPKKSPWRSTPRDRRTRPGVQLTLSREAMAALDVMAELAGSRSALVDRLILEEAKRRGVSAEPSEAP